MKINEIREQVDWKDLRELTLKGKYIENSFNIPWLIISLTLAFYGHYILAIPFSAIYFMTTLRQVHNGIHNSLGINKKWTRFSLLLNSILMSVSTTAIKYNHMRHHKYNLSEEDYEGITAKMKWYTAIFYGPIFMFNLHIKTIQSGNEKYKQQLFIDTICIIIFVFFVFFFNLTFLKYHIAFMMFCEGLMAFFAVWAVHHDTEDNPEFARTQRGSGWKNFITVGMFHHLEHHLFPAIPTYNLNIISKRLDEKFPNLNKRQVF